MDLDWLFDDVVRRVAVVHQQHSIKCGLAIQRLTRRFPGWGPEAARKLAVVLREEPVAGDMGAGLEGPVDVETVGGNRRLVEKAIFPAAYVAMRQWVAESSLDEILEVYREYACAEPDYLGHNVSIYCSLVGFRPQVEGRPERMARYLDRLTEFVTATFHCPQNRIVFQREADAELPATEEAVLRAAFRRPGFFGHQILALVWARRFQRDLGPEGYRRVLRHVAEMSYWLIPERNRFALEPHDGPLREADFEEAIRRLAFEGPENIHRVTLADALTNVWDHTSDDMLRALALSAAVHFARTSRAE